MKRIFQFLLFTAIVISFASLSLAGTIKGKLTKIDQKTSMYTIEDSKGKHEVHVDASTKKKGEIKTGAMVEVEEERGHAKSIEVEHTKEDKK